jgi:hypothetical protein
VGYLYVGRDWSIDYSKEESPVRKEAFWHEFYHLFEVKQGIVTYARLVANIAISPIGSAQYEYNPDKPFMEQNPEARAEYFGRCMAGLGPCDALKQFSYNPDGQTRITFSNGVFTVKSIPTGSRIPLTTTVKGKGAGGSRSGQDQKTVAKKKKKS